MFKKIFAVALIFSALFLYCGKSSDKDLKIYQVKYADSMFPKKFIFHNYKGEEKSPFAWKFYYISYKGINILIDTGFNNPKLIKLFNLQNFIDPVEILKENGIEADQITDIIITHHHFDHIGSVHKFKNSNIYIQENEFKEVFKLRGFQDIKDFLKKNNRIITFKDSLKLYDNINIEKVGGHSIGSSVVFLKHNDIEFCFTGDEIYSQKNVDEQIGVGSFYNHQKNIDFIKRLAKGNYKIFNFHEPDFEKFNENFVQVYP